MRKARKKKRNICVKKMLIWSVCWVQHILIGLHTFLLYLFLLLIFLMLLLLRDLQTLFLIEVLLRFVACAYCVPVSIYLPGISTFCKVSLQMNFRALLLFGAFKVVSFLQAYFSFLSNKHDVLKNLHLSSLF